MPKDENDSLPAHLRALLGGEEGTLRREAEKALGRSVERITTGRFGRAFKLGSLAASGGARVAMGRARQMLGRDGPTLSRDEGVALATQMLETFSELRGIAMKVGQMLSYVDDGLPPEMQKLLALLQRDAPPMPFDTVRTILAQELGRDPDQVFRSIEPVPLAAASIGQVHRAVLADGTAVAVKAQYPGIDKAMRSDLKNGKVGALFNRMLFVNTDVKGIMDELEERLLDECDYRKEAEYQRAFGQRFKGHPIIVVPEVHDISTQRVLVTTLHHGHSFYEWLATNPSAAERDRVTRAFYRFYLGSFYMDGLFNCDPHPGNYLFRDDGRIVFLDYGCCRRFNDERRRTWCTMAQAVRRDDPEEMDRVGRVIGFIPPGVEYDRAGYRTLLRYIYEPYLLDEPYDFAVHRPAKTFRSMFTENTNLFRMNMPADSVFLNRITFGLVSLMADIGSKLNIYRHADHYFAGNDPDWPEDPVLAAAREKSRAG
jgi:predicted unusual protein kinase regulating ubiquinone biosynthesis (AarF/ABC1/UbiB family)